MRRHAGNAVQLTLKSSLANPIGQREVETGRRRQRAELAHPRRGAACRFADDQALPHLVSDKPRSTALVLA